MCCRQSMPILQGFVNLWPVAACDAGPQIPVQRVQRRLCADRSDARISARGRQAGFAVRHCQLGGWAKKTQGRELEVSGLAQVAGNNFRCLYSVEDRFRQATRARSPKQKNKPVPSSNTADDGSCMAVPKEYNVSAAMPASHDAHSVAVLLCPLR